MVLLDTTSWGTLALAVSKVHYLMIITADPYIPYYIIVHEWRTQMQECIYMDNKSTTRLNFQGSKLLLPPLNL